MGIARSAQHCTPPNASSEPGLALRQGGIEVCVICGVKLGEFHRTSNTFGILSMALQVLVVPTIYQGLLSISVPPARWPTGLRKALSPV